eukprot:204561_1
MCINAICYMLIMHLFTACNSQMMVSINTTIISLAPTKSPLNDVNQLITCTDCANQQINCTNSFNECVIICVLPYSCNNAIFNCNNATNCNITCVALHSCQSTTINCANNADCHINGNKKLSLYNSKINGPTLNGKLFIYCNGYQTCLNSNIIANKSNHLQIYCTGSNSCKNIIIHCPYIKHNITKHCIIIGNSDLTNISDTNSDIIIHTQHSWFDVEFIQYLPFISDNISIMYCNNDKCIINNPHIESEWNCKDVLSKCYVENKNITIIYCNNTNICTSSTINCNKYAGNGCRIICEDSNACLNTNIICGNNDKECRVACIGNNSCVNANIFGSIHSHIDISCVGFNACKQTNFYANISNKLNIKC